MSFCVYTILYTLEDKKPEENDYVQMFLLWLGQFIKVKAAESIVILIDSRTLEYLDTTVFTVLCEKLQYNLSILQFPIPKSHLEGMKMKYTVFDYEEEYLMYLDLDILVLKPLMGLIGDTGKDIYIDAEGSVEEHGYLDAFNEKEKGDLIQNGVKYGISAGKFIIRNKEKGKVLFSEIHKFIANNPGTTYYSVEQPIFNRVLLCMGSYVDAAIIDPKYISANFHNMSDDTILLDFYGNPGDGRNHLYKMIGGVVAFT